MTTAACSQDTSISRQPVIAAAISPHMVAALREPVLTR